MGLLTVGVLLPTFETVFLLLVKLAQRQSEVLPFLIMSCFVPFGCCLSEDCSFLKEVIVCGKSRIIYVWGHLYLYIYKIIKAA